MGHWDLRRGRWEREYLGWSVVVRRPRGGKRWRWEASRASATHVVQMAHDFDSFDTADEAASWAESQLSGLTNEDG